MTPDCVGSVINVQIYDADGFKTEVTVFYSGPMRAMRNYDHEDSI